MIIGLTGKARSGKDTVAEHLRIAYGFNHYWFSKPMKEACKAIFGWTDEHLYGDLKEVVDPNYVVSPRVALQTLGTEWGRSINSDLWILRAKKEMEQDQNLVISDCRFDNEAKAIREKGGIIIRVEREGIQSVADHSSENGISEILVSLVIKNDGTLQDLYKKVDNLLLKQLAA